MVTNGNDLSSIEVPAAEGDRRARRARDRGDLSENVFRVHTPLEDALDAVLGEEAADLAFSQKFERRLPRTVCILRRRGTGATTQLLASETTILGRVRQGHCLRLRRVSCGGVAEAVRARWPDRHASGPLREYSNRACGSASTRLRLIRRNLPSQDHRSCTGSHASTSYSGSC